MSEAPNPEVDPESTRPIGDVSRYTRRKITPAHLALAFVLAVLITAVTFGILSVVLWAVASLLH